MVAYSKQWWGLGRSRSGHREALKLGLRIPFSPLLPIQGRGGSPEMIGLQMNS